MASPYISNTNQQKCDYTFVDWKPNPVWVFKSRNGV